MNIPVVAEVSADTSTLMLTEAECQRLIKLSTERWISTDAIEQIQKDIEFLNDLAYTAVGDPILFKTASQQKDLRELLKAAQSMERTKQEIIEVMQRYLPI